MDQPETSDSGGITAATTPTGQARAVQALRARPRALLAAIVAAAVVLLVGGVVVVQVATRNPCEKYVTYSDHLDEKYGTYDDVVAGLASLSPDEDRKLYQLHVACNDYDDTHPGAWDDAVYQ